MEVKGLVALLFSGGVDGMNALQPDGPCVLVCFGQGDLLGPRPDRHTRNFGARSANKLRTNVITSSCNLQLLKSPERKAKYVH